jgi:phasin family protein
MFNPDFQKMFDPQAFTKSMQQFMDFNGAARNSKQGYETWKKIGGIVADTYSTCAEKQLRMAQGAMEDCIEGMRELSTAKGMEDFMARQSEWTKKCAEKVQSNAQEMAELMQKGQSQCSDLISKMMMGSMEWAKGFQQNVQASANNVTKNN